ncbi:hypothetical protein FF1_000663 [Malus domestica]
MPNKKKPAKHQSLSLFLFPKIHLFLSNPLQVLAFCAPLPNPKARTPAQNPIQSVAISRFSGNRYAVQNPSFISCFSYGVSVFRFSDLIWVYQYFSTVRVALILKCFEIVGSVADFRLQYTLLVPRFNPKRM